MKRVALVGFDPATVDFSDPALPPGMTAEKIHAGVKLAVADFAARGWHPEICFIKPDDTAIPSIERCLAGGPFDCVVIGAGVRLASNRLVLFEAVVNAIHRAAPQAVIAFNSRPEDSGAAAALDLTRFATAAPGITRKRWLPALAARSVSGVYRCA